MLVKPEFLSIAYGGFRRALLEWKAGKNSIKQIEEKYKDTQQIINKVTQWINYASNPIVKQILLVEKLCNKTHDDIDKLVNYVKRQSKSLHDSEQEKVEKLNIISDAINELEKFLESEDQMEESK